MYEDLALLGGFVLLYSIVAGGIERSWISGPMVFTAFGVLIGPVGLDLLSLQTDRETLQMLAELTLALVLFTDAAGADPGALRKAARIPVRLLLIGLPLTIAFGYVVARALDLDLSPVELALLATMLAPTDAALGKAVVTNTVVPEDVREGLNVESGLNDGICVPILFVFLALARQEGAGEQAWSLALKLVAQEIGIGLAVGLVLTAIVVGLLKIASRHHWISTTWVQIPVVALALTCFASAQLLGGSGFIAAFTGGLLFGSLEQRHRKRLLLAAEGTGDTFALITWVIFGSAVIGKAIGHFSWPIVIYAVLSLTLIRMLPVYLALAGSGVDNAGKLFIGWFGPRGLASIVFAVIVVDANLPNSGAIAMVVVSAILLSILAHGLTANPLARAYGARARMRP
ncbi:MAG TPA: sodium:proton antiporter [Gammaproteobacteria bacterium]|nr:sodium:proton antiporter [Gammaproteobacteria bacterium]